MNSYIVITNNSESYIHDVLWSLLPLQENEELIIFDNLSSDNTVPNIVATMGSLWLDDKYKFYINNKKEDIETIKNKALSIAKGKAFIIDKKEKFDIKEVLNNA